MTPLHAQDTMNRAWKGWKGAGWGWGLVILRSVSNAASMRRWCASQIISMTPRRAACTLAASGAIVVNRRRDTTRRHHCFLITPALDPHRTLRHTARRIARRTVHPRPAIKHAHHDHALPTLCLSSADTRHRLASNTPYNSIPWADGSRCLAGRTASARPPSLRLAAPPPDCRATGA